MSNKRHQQDEAPENSWKTVAMFVVLFFWALSLI